MAVVRLIHIKVDPSQSDEVERIWNQECSALMIQENGCQAEQLLKCGDAPGEFISYSEWDSQADIDAYRDSEAHREIQAHSRKLQGAKAVVKCYEIIGNHVSEDELSMMRNENEDLKARLKRRSGFLEAEDC